MTQPVSPDSALKRAVARLGSQGAMARLCGVKQPSVWGWLNKIGQLPAEHVLKVEAATGVSRHDLRPDIYPIESDTAPVPLGREGAGPALHSSKVRAGQSSASAAGVRA